MRQIKVFALLVFLSAAGLGQIPADKVQSMAEIFVSAYNANEYAKIEAQFNEMMAAAVPVDKLTLFLNDSHRDLGKIVKLGPANHISPNVATFPLEFEKAKQELLISLDADGKIGGLRITAPAKVNVPNTGRNKTTVRLPFIGDWLVFWGGDTPEQNYHQDFPNQRFAFDILKADADGKTHKGDGKANEDYYAFGQEIVADADGVVTNVVTGVRDNIPGVMNPLMAVGNVVMVRHENGEVSVFCHLKYDSTRVKVGDKVTKGQVIGLCGNTGNSSEAHLHYQVQGTAIFEAENSMKVFFEKMDVRRDGKTETKTDYSPVKGDIVSAAGLGNSSEVAPSPVRPELIKLAQAFGDLYKNADQKGMEQALGDDFRYVTNVPCPYKDCAKGANKQDYIKGVIDERKQLTFTVKSIEMTPIADMIDVGNIVNEIKVSFYCKLKTAAKGKDYVYPSVIDYYFRPAENGWKIKRIENRFID